MPLSKEFWVGWSTDSKAADTFSTFVWFSNYVLWHCVPSHIQYSTHSLSPDWILWCSVSSPFDLKAFSHLHHLYNFSIWVLLCVISSPFDMKALTHSLHSYMLLPVWIFWCCVSSPFVIKSLLHSVHLYGLSPVCDLWCTIKFSFVI